MVSLAVMNAFPAPLSSRTIRAAVSFVAGCLALTAGELHAEYTWAEFAGKLEQFGEFKDGTGKEARFRNPNGLALSSLDGNLYVVDAGNHAIRKITPSGEVTTVAGGPKKSSYADGDCAQAGFPSITYIAASGSGDLFVSQPMSPPAIRRIMPEGGVLTVKTPKNLFDAAFVTGVVVTSQNDLVVGYLGEQIIYKITPDGRATLFAGKKKTEGDADGPGPKARFFRPEGLAIDAQDNVYVADSWNQTVRKISSDGTVTTLAGSPRSEGKTDGVGAAARFKQPTGIAVDARGTVYVTDLFNNRVCTISPAGLVTTIGSAFDHPKGIAVDKLGCVYVADSGRHCIMRGTPSSLVPDPMTATLLAQQPGPAPASSGSSATRPGAAAPMPAATPTSAPAPAGKGAGLSSKDVIALLGAGFTPADVIAEVQKRGYQGGTDAAALQQIRAAGGNVDLIVALNNAPAPAAGTTSPVPAPSAAAAQPPQPAQNTLLQKLSTWVLDEMKAERADGDDEYFVTDEWLSAFLMFGAATSMEETEGIMPMQKEWPKKTQALYPQIVLSDSFDPTDTSDSSEAKAYKAIKLLQEWWEDVEVKIPPLRSGVAAVKAAGKPLYSLTLRRGAEDVIWLDVCTEFERDVVMVIALGTGKALDAIADKHVKPPQGTWVKYRAMHKSYALTRWPSYGRKDWLFQSEDAKTLAIWHQQSGGHPPSAENYPSVLSTYNTSFIIVDRAHWETLFKDAPDFQELPVRRPVSNQ